MKNGERLKKRPKALGTANSPEGKRPKNKPILGVGIASTTYPYCGQFYRLEKYYYTFPDLAPNGFVKREHIRIRVKEALLNPELEKEVERLKN